MLRFTDAFDGHRISLPSEVAYPPFGDVLTVDSQPPLDQGLAEITHFAAYEYAKEITAPLHLPVLPTHT